MQKLLLLLILLSLGFFAFSQTEKGRFVISGKTDLSFLATKTKQATDSLVTQEIHSKNFKANPTLAYFVMDHLAVGISGSFNYERNQNAKNSSLPYSHSWMAGVLPSITYFIPVEGNLKPNLGIAAGYLWLFNNSGDLQGPSLNGQAGASYFVNRQVSLDLGIQYVNNRLKDNQHPQITYKQTAVGALFGVSVFF